MKKRILSFIIVILMLLVTGCSNEKYKYEFDNSVLQEEIYIDEFDISKLQLKIIQNKEVVGYLIASVDMFSAEDRQLLNTVGTHNVTIKYLDYSYTFTITLKQKEYTYDVRYEFDNSCATEYYIDEFDISSLQLKMYKNNVFVKFIKVTKYMFSDEDLELLKTVGTHNVTIKYVNFSYDVTIILKESKNINVFKSDNKYYEAANGYTGEQLKLSLRKIISVVKKVETYGDLRYDLPKSDVDPNNPNNIMLFYTGKSVSSKWDGGNTWNREHIWPQSLGWFKTTNAGADMHHIRPTDPSENSSRGNKKFGSVKNSKYYEPRDEIKGDIARIIFYLMVRYQEADNYTFKTVAESKELLLTWNQIDPVDEFEMNRNEIIYSIQGNRNPFIDHPETANLIWGTVTVSYDNNEYISTSYIINVVYYIDDKKEYYIQYI